MRSFGSDRLHCFEKRWPLPGRIKRSIAALLLQEHFVDLLTRDGDDVVDGQGGTDTLAGNEGADTLNNAGDVIDETFTLSATLLTALEEA